MPSEPSLVPNHGIGLVMAESVGYKLAEFCIPTDILVPGSEIKREYLTAPTCPVIVFINCKSGGQLGGDLLKTYQDLLNKNQVFDLGTWAPDKVLHQLYSNIEKLKQGGDKLAYEIEKRLRIIVAGGDGTAGWILGVVCDLKLPLPPPVVTVPLGTGNNLPFSFGWVRFRSCVRAGYLLVSAATANIAGERPVSMCLPLAYDPFSHQGKKNPGIDHQSVEAFLEEVKTARVMQVDSWHILMKMKAPEKGPCDPIAPLELPNALHAFRRISQKEPCDGYHTYRGGFWNYFSMGMDAQVSYAFHSERKLHPEKFRNQLLNQSAYAKLGCKQGWFCASLLHPSSRNIAQLTKVKVMRRPGHWEELDIPRCIRSIICLNLPSFSGGFNPWGTPCRKRSLERGFTHPFVDDSLIEIVGFKDAWHGLVLLAPHGHGTRLAQANRVRFEFHKGVADHTFMRIDGEPWKQPLPLDDDTVVVEISHFSRVSILARPPCRSKSIYEPSSPFSPRFEGDDSDIEVANESWEERRKLGVADTFKIEDVDFSHLS